MLEADWDALPRKAPPRAAKAAAAAGGWRGRAPAMVALIRYHLSFHPEPVAALLHLTSSMPKCSDASGVCAGDLCSEPCAC